MSRTFGHLLLPLFLSCSPTVADTTAGIFAILDEVVLEPTDRNPDRVRLRGVFVVPQPISSGLHLPPQRGELYFSVNPEHPDESRADWLALRDASGSGEVVAFAEYWMPAGNSALLRSLPEAAEQRRNASINTSLVVTLHTDASPVLPEPYPLPNRAGIITRFDSQEQLCPRFGASSTSIIVSLWAAHDRQRIRRAPPLCETRLGLIDSRDLDTAFVDQHRDAAWADATETMLHQRIADSGLELAQLTVECRYTICHVGLVYPTIRYQTETGDRLTAAALKDLPGIASGGKIVPSPDGAPMRDFWMQRRSPEECCTLPIGKP